MASHAGSNNCLRYLTILFNFIVFVCGIVLMAFASYLLHTLNSTFSGFRAQEYGVVVGLLVLGFLIFLLGFLGCCGAWKESVCMLTTFAVIVGILLLVEIVVAIVGFVFKDKIPALVDEFLNSELANALKGSSPTLENIETTFKCCGVKGRSDYPSKVPTSCDNFVEGCSEKVEKFIMSHSTTLFIVAIVVALVQLAAVIVACCLQSNIRRYQAV